MQFEMVHIEQQYHFQYLITYCNILQYIAAYCIF